MGTDMASANIEAKQRLVSALRGKGSHLQMTEAVAGFPAPLMNTAPENVTYTFWHQLEHIRFCQFDILRYVLDPEYVSPEWPGGYWRGASETANQAAWDETIALYHSDMEEFVQLIEREDTNVLEPVVHNAGRSIMGSALTAIRHTSYHLGEFVMGRQILGAWKSVTIE